MGGMGGMGSMGGMGGMRGFGGMGGMAPGMGGRGGPARPSRARSPPRDEGPRQDIGCKCGYSCGTMKALEKHLARFPGDPAHEKQVTERPPSPPRIPREMQGEYPGDLPPGLAEKLGLRR